MPDTSIRYQFTANNQQAIAAVRELTQKLQAQRETWKQSIYDEKSRRAEVVAQIKKQELGIFSLEKAEQKQAREKLKLLKAEESALGAKNRASIAAEQARLRILERKEVGVTGLDRHSINGGLLPGFGRLAQMGGINIPAPLQAMADAFKGSDGRSGGRMGGSLFAQAKATQSAAGLAETAMGGLGSSALSLGAALGTGGLIGVFAAATTAAGEFSRQFEEANKRETQTIVTTGQIVNAIGGDRSQARGLVDQFNRSLSKESGGLVATGESGAIGRGILDDILAGAKQSGRSNSDAVGQAARISTGLAGLSKATGTDTSQLANVLSDISSRSQSVDQLRGRDVLNDLGINKVLIPELEKRGIKKLSELTQDQVFGLLENAVTKSFSVDTRRELEGTTQGLFASLKYQFFDPFEGIFSIERQLPDGGGSVFEAAKDVLKTLLEKPDGLFPLMGTIFKDLGVTIEPLKDLRDQIKGFNAWLKELQDTLKGLQQGKIDFGSAGKSALDIAGYAAKTTTGLGALDPLINSIFGARPKYLGTPAASGFMPLGRAIASEVKNKPSGSGLVVANTSEIIQTKPQFLSSLLSAKSVGAQSAAIYVGGITIHQQPNEDGDALANRIIEKLDQLVSSERNYRLA